MMAARLRAALRTRTPSERPANALRMLNAQCAMRNATQCAR